MASLFGLTALIRLPGVVLLVRLAIVKGKQRGWRFRPSDPARDRIGSLAGFAGFALPELHDAGRRMTMILRWHRRPSAPIHLTINVTVVE
jgi:hypothetical protein